MAEVNNNKSKIYGWVSKKALLNSEHIVIYKKMDGLDVSVTTITNSNTNSMTLWDDIMFIGELSHFVSSSQNINRLSSILED